MEKWTVAGKPRMALFAGEAGIMTGEELTYDYNFDPYSQKNVQVCRCGADTCRGVLGPKPKDLPNKEREGRLAGAKRKIGEILEEGGNLLNKKRKVNDEPPKLPKGWAYVEPVAVPKVKKAKLSTEKKHRDGDGDGKDDGALSRPPSRLKRMLSHKSNTSKSAKAKSIASVKRRSGARVVSTESGTALIASAADEENTNENEDGNVKVRPASGLSKSASFKAKADGLRKFGRSLKGRV